MSNYHDEQNNWRLVFVFLAVIVGISAIIAILGGLYHEG